MENERFIKTQANEDRKKDENEHNEAFDFTKEQMDMLRHYGRGSVNIKPSPKGLDTFAFNLEKNEIYVNSRFYKNKGFNFSEEATLFASFHEIEHFLEKKQLLSEEGGEKIFDRYLKKLEESKAYGVMDNCIADIRENKTVIQKTNKENEIVEREMYKKDLFEDIDFTKMPKHLQLPQAILRESRVSEEVCRVSEEVRMEIEKLKNIKSPDGDSFLDVLTDPSTPMSLRMKLQDIYIWPVVKKLLKEDIREKENQNKSENSEEDSQNDSNNGKDGKDSNEGKNAKDLKSNPNEVFQKEYEEFESKNPNAMDIKEIKKDFKKYKRSKNENSLDKADESYAQSIGVEKEDLQKYRNIVKSLEEIINKETGENTIEELRNIFEKIISKRKNVLFSPKYPTEEGEFLIDPTNLITEVKSGNLKPKVWESFERKEQKSDKFGEVEITLVCDRSGSMYGEKAIEQQISTVLIMETLKDFSERCEEEKNNLIKPIEIRSEIYSFQGDYNDSRPLKKMSKELGEKERIDIASILSETPGNSTTDFIPLENIFENIDEKIKNKIRTGELKKIVFIMTDGESSDPIRVKNITEKLRKEGVVIVGIGITEDGEAVRETYAPKAEVAKEAKDLPIVLAGLLKEHLADI